MFHSTEQHESSARALEAWKKSSCYELCYQENDPLSTGACSHRTDVKLHMESTLD